jgi:2-C-methyl-D-erythritol 4-phosphate cytidylyltransferase
MSTEAVIVAAGRAERFGGPLPKQFCILCGRPVLSWTISRLESAAAIDRIVVVVAEAYLRQTVEQIIDPFGFSKVTKVVSGGATRIESVRQGLKAVSGAAKLVAVHDGARPVVRPADIDRVVETARQEKAAMLALPATDTVKQVRGGYIEGTLDRNSLYLAQTPQVFARDLIMAAHRQTAPGMAVTDDASLVEAQGVRVRIVEPSGPNLKITGPDDLILAAALLNEETEISE